MKFPYRDRVCDDIAMQVRLSAYRARRAMYDALIGSRLVDQYGHPVHSVVVPFDGGEKVTVPVQYASRETFVPITIDHGHEFSRAAMVPSPVLGINIVDA